MEPLYKDQSHNSPVKLSYTILATLVTALINAVPIA